MPANSATARQAVAAITNFEKRTVDGISDPHVEVRWWRKNGLFNTNSHGTSIRWQAVTARQQVRGFNRETISQFAPTNRLITASLSNAGYSAVGQVHQTDLWECKGEQQIIDLLKHEMQWIPECIWRALIQDWLLDGTSTTNSSNPITGLPGGVKSSGSYGGVAYADEPTFFGSGNNILTGGVHATFSLDPVPSLTASVLAGEQGADAGQGSTQSDGIFMSYADWATTHNSLQAQGVGTLEASKYTTGAKDLVYMGVPIMRSRFQTAGTYWTLNSSFMDWRFPSPEVINTFKREEPSPWSVILLMAVYGLFRITLPRAQVKTTVS